MSGSLYEPTTLDNLTVTDGPDELRRDTVYWWNGPSYEALGEGEDIIPGRGYWLASGDNCEVTLQLPLG